MVSEAAGMSDSSEFDLIVVGGGAAGFFAAITCAEFAPEARILILEKSPKVLGKVKISGGGRCNVTHACFDPRELTSFYPRGSKQLMGPFHRWGPAETMDWFESRDVPLKVESDNRVFPESDDSQSVIDCLTRCARQSGVVVRTGCAVVGAKKSDVGAFEVEIGDDDRMTTRCLAMTTGGSRDAVGARIAANFGHRLESAAPSLFTFKIDDPRLGGLQGLSVPNASVKVAPPNNAADLEASGPVLITHWGLSGPGILRVSAWGARVLQKLDYRFDVALDWSGGDGRVEPVVGAFDRLRSDSPKRAIVNDPQFDIPSRLWRRLVQAGLGKGGKSADEIAGLRWPHLSRDAGRGLAGQIADCRFRVTGKSMNKEEFVTCGGVTLGEVNFKTMESRVTPGLFFAGELLDIDGVTGGFNFQAAWTTGRIAGEAIAGLVASSS